MWQTWQFGYFRCFLEYNFSKIRTTLIVPPYTGLECKWETSWCRDPLCLAATILQEFLWSFNSYSVGYNCSSSLACLLHSYRVRRFLVWLSITLIFTLTLFTLFLLSLVESFAFRMPVIQWTPSSFTALKLHLALPAGSTSLTKWYLTHRCDTNSSKSSRNVWSFYGVHVAHCWSQSNFMDSVWSKCAYTGQLASSIP